MQGQGVGTLTWSVAVQWICRLWGFPEWCRPRSAPTCALPGATLPDLQSNLRWLLLVLGLEIPWRSQAVNLGWLLLVPVLGLTEDRCCLFEGI